MWAEEHRGRYVGRFAPSPTGPLHAGSLVAALASWLDARAHQGRWLVRIEDVDTPRCPPGTAELILAQLAAAGLAPDEPPWHQSKRDSAYQSSLARLQAQDSVFRCGCSRSDIAAAWAEHGVPADSLAARVYPGTCRGRPVRQPALAWRLRTYRTDSAPLALGAAVCDDGSGDVCVTWHDRRLGAQWQNVTREVGDFVLRRADGLWSYQLAVVVDDAAQGVTHVVRGEDLADNTARQIHLQRQLGLPTPAYLHTPLVRAHDGQKLSKQTGAQAVDLGDPLAALCSAGRHLGLPSLASAEAGSNVSEWLAQAVAAWGAMRWHDAHLLPNGTL